MKLFVHFTIVTCLLFSMGSLTAQVTSNNAGVKSDSFLLEPKPKVFPTYRVAIFAPLYLDSAFTGSFYRYGKEFPRFTLAGFEFAQGALMALDSMPVFGGNVQASVYDTKSYTKTIASIAEGKELDSTHLIIGSVRDAEYLHLANVALQKNIPFVSVTYPNDAGVMLNPNVAIVNSTLRAHCEAIFGYILQNRGNSNVLLVRKRGAQEERIQSYFNAINRPDSLPLIKINSITIENDSSFYVIKKLLDSTRRTFVIGASLSEYFGNRLVTELAAWNSKYPTTLFGMPNWEGLSSLRKKAVKDYPVYFTRPFFNKQNDSRSLQLRDAYLAKYRGIPSEMFYRGYEAAYVFTKILMAHPDSMMQHLNDTPYKMFSEFNFKPVHLSKETTVPDYYENKHMQFMKLENGFASRAWEFDKQ